MYVVCKYVDGIRHHNLMDSFQSLKHLGLSKEESQTFEALLAYRNGISVMSLAKKLNKPRATLYDHLRVLVNAGVAKKGRTEKGSVFYPESQEMIRGAFAERSQSTARAGAIFATQIKELSQVETYDPRLTVVDNKNAAKIIFGDVLRSGVKECSWFWPARALLQTSVPNEVFMYWHAERIRKKMRAKILWPFNQKAKLTKDHVLAPGKDKESLREIRIMPAQVDATMGYGIYGNKVGFISSARENYGFIVDSREFSQTLKSQFDFFWSVSKKR